MAFEFKLPDIGEGVVEGEIVAWQVKEGDTVKHDQPMVEVMTDKATVEIPSPRAGHDRRRSTYKDGEICPVGKVLVVIDEDGAAPREPQRQRPPTPTRGARRRRRAAVDAAPAPRRAAVEPTAAAARSRSSTRRRRAQRVLATPATRKLARELGVDLGRVPADRQARPRHHRRRAAASAHGGADGAPRSRRVATPYAPVAIADGGDEERIPFRGMRKKIAERWRARCTPRRTSRSSRSST